MAWPAPSPDNGRPKTRRLGRVNVGFSSILIRQSGFIGENCCWRIFEIRCVSVYFGILFPLSVCCIDSHPLVNTHTVRLCESFYAANKISV